jgi:hypothetical protein
VGGFSLRAYSQGGQEEPSRGLLAVEVLRADGIVFVRPEASSDAAEEGGPPREVTGVSPMREASLPPFRYMP